MIVSRVLSSFRTRMVLSQCSSVIKITASIRLSTTDSKSTDQAKRSGPSFMNEGDEFRYLLRHSNFINLGDPEGKLVKGTIFLVVENDLYVDFGWKFYCVCPKPTKGGERYVRGASLLLKIKTLELSSMFLGADKGLTLLEADASIVKLLSSPVTIQVNST